MSRDKTILYVNGSIIGVVCLLSIFITGTFGLSGIVILMGLSLIAVEVLLTKINIKIKNKIIIVLSSVVALLLLLLIANFVVEISTSSILMYRVTHPGFVLFIYAAPILLLSFFLIEKYISNKNLYIMSHFVLAFLIMGVGAFDILSVFLGTSSMTEVPFEEPDVTILLVENSFIFSSSHELYEKESTFYGSRLEADGSLTCDDGCMIKTPEQFTWNWIDDYTLVVSSDHTYEEVTFHRETE